MSSILKALKKLEEERSSVVDRAEQIARYPETAPRRRSRPNRTILLLFCGVVIGALSVGGWFLLTAKPAEEKPLVAAPAGVPPGENSQHAEPEKQAVRSDMTAGEVSAGKLADPTRETSLPHAVVSPSQELSAAPTAEIPPREPSSPQAVTAPPPGAEAAKPEQPSRPVARAPRKTAETAPRPVAKTPVKPAVPAKPAAALPAQERPAAASPPEPVVVEEVVLPAPASVAAAGKEPGSTPQVSSLYKLTEIYRQDAGGSVAVINDLPVMEGTQFNGAMVEKILADRVRLIIDGTPVDILLETKP